VSFYISSDLIRASFLTFWRYNFARIQHFPYTCYKSILLILFYLFILIYLIKVKVKVPYNSPESPEGCRGIAVFFLDLGYRRWWVVSTTLRPLYPRERPDTYCTGGWVGPRVWTCAKNLAPTGIRSLNRPARS
jgi:hypothetical protein